MANITAADVKKLRDATGAGMMDCKKALVEAEGNYDEAVAILRKKGQKVAEKRADRDSSEGAAIAVVNDSKTEGALIVLGCETDFVGKNSDFVALATSLAELAMNHNDQESFLNADFGGMTVAEKMIEQTGVIGEKIQINGFKRLAAPFYIGCFGRIWPGDWGGGGDYDCGRQYRSRHPSSYHGDCFGNGKGGFCAGPWAGSCPHCAKFMR